MNLFFILYLIAAFAWAVYAVYMEFTIRKIKNTPRRHYSQHIITFAANFIAFPIAVFYAIRYKKLTMAMIRKKESNDSAL